MIKWIAGINRPYYPRIEYFLENEEREAEKCYQELLDEHEDDGKYDGYVFIAKVMDIAEIKTY